MRIQFQVNYQLYIIFSLLISLSLQDGNILYQSDKTHQNKRKLFSADTCQLNDQIYDSSTSGACFECTDKFVLPDCSTCPFGYKISTNQDIKVCEKCPDGQIFCDNGVAVECFNGYTKDSQTRQCSCKSPNVVRYEWCTNDQEFYYYSFYQDGQIKSKFSAEIVLKEQISFDNYSFNKENCLALENLNTNYQTIKDKIECRIDPNQKNVFAISLKNIDVTNKSYEDIPIFNKEILQIQLGIKNIQNPNLIYQNTNQESTKKVQMNLSSQQNDECQFKYNLYRLLPGQNIIPKSHLVLKNFERTMINFKLQQQEILKNPEIDREILNGLNQYPNDMIFKLPNFPDSENQEPISYPISFQCQLPFGLLSTSQFQIIFQNQYFFEYQIQMQETYLNSDNILAQITLGKSQFQQGDTFIATIEVINSLNSVEHTSPELIFQVGIAYQINQFLLKPDRYTLKLSIRYILEQESQILRQPFRVDESPFYCKINGGDQQNINPSNAITITGQIFSSKYQDLSDYQYEWSCSMQNSENSCRDKFQNPLQFKSSTEITIPDDSFDFSEIYTIQLFASLISDPNVFFFTRIKITTQKSTIDVQFDQNYTRNGLNFDQLLQFNLIYSQNINESRRLLWAANKDFKHHFELQFQEQPLINSESQIEPQFYFRLKDLTKGKIQAYTQFYIRFFVADTFGTIGASQKYTFYLLSPPQECSLQIGQLSGLEKAFNDLINIDIQNCQSFGGSLYYLFMYMKENDIQTQESTNSDIYLRNYLTKFSLKNKISTYLPPGKITISVLVKDFYQSKTLLQQSITIQKSGFNLQQYETFLTNQFQEANNHKNNNEFEEELCTIGMIIDCITDFESENINEDPSQAIVDIKIQLNDRLKTLPNQIPNTLMSQQLQEYILRCLDKLFKTKKSPFYDNIMERFDQLQEIIQNSIQQIGQMKPFLQELKDTYSQQMKVAFNMTAQQIKEINKTPQNLTLWNEKQIQGFQKIQNCVALTLNVNQPKIDWSNDILQLIVHRVDYQLLQKQYLNIDQNDQQNIDSLVFYDVKSQNWNKNIYADEDSFKLFVKPYYQNASEDVKQELDRVYPAINTEISMWQDIPIYSRRNLLLNKEENLVLPNNSTIFYQFNHIEGSGEVVCTQKISQIWSTKQCKTEFQNIEGKMQVICSCSKPSYTTLIYDFESLLKNDNIAEMFSIKGIMDIINWTNWYEYAAIYTIFIINLGFIIALIFLNNKDKRGLFDDRDVFVFMQSQCLQRLQLQRFSDHDLYKNQNDQNEQKDNDIESLKNIRQSATSINMNQYQLNAKTMEEIKRSQKTSDHINTDTRNIIEQSSDSRDSKIDVYKHQNNNTDIEQNKQQINAMIAMNQIQQCNQPGFRQYFVESENKTLHVHQNPKQFKQKDPKMTQIQIIQQNRVKRKSQQYLQGIAKLKAVGTFHEFFQIFLLFNKKNSRVFRLCIYYSNIIWLLAINATFGKSLTTSQVFILSFITSLTFGVYAFIFQLLQKNNILKYFSYFICTSFLIFCYYAIVVSISNSTPEEANVWIYGYFETLFINIFIFGVVIAFIKLLLTKKLLELLSPSSFIFSITGADAIFQMFE